MRWFKRLIAVAVLSMSAALAGVGASYGQDKVVRIGFQKYGKLVLLKGKGSLEEKLKPLGYKVSWTEFPSGPPLLEALNVGAIDFGVAGETPPIFACTNAKIVLINVFEHGSRNEQHKARRQNEPRSRDSEIPQHAGGSHAQEEFQIVDAIEWNRHPACVDAGHRGQNRCRQNPRSLHSPSAYTAPV